MNSIWIRLGGFVYANDETMKRILNGDIDSLIKAIKDNGFELNGESYIPNYEFGTFEISPIKLEMKQ